MKVKCIDKYNREVAFVYCEEKDVSVEMLKEGMALHYHMNFDKCEMYDKFEAAAKRYRQGLWSQEKLKSLGILEENIGRRMNNVYQNFYST